MKLVAIAVRDRQVGAFGNPMFVPAVGVAIRSFTDEVNRADKDNQLYLHPDDFDLFQLSVFDTDTGLFEVPVNGQPVQIALGKNVAIRNSNK